MADVVLDVKGLNGVVVPVRYVEVEAGIYAPATAVVGSGGAAAASEAHIGQVGGNSAFLTVEKTRPNDATPYAVNDAINESASAGTVWTFTNALRKAGGGATIIYACLATDQVANVATYRMYFYGAAPTAINDNAELTLLYANLATYIGYIDFPALVKDSAASTAAKFELSGALLHIPEGMAAGRDIIGTLKTTAIFTPATNQKYRTSLKFAWD